MTATPPVALLLFNRPDTTRRVFAAIREARPARLLLIADGPRPDRPDDARLCAEARAVTAAVDWPCDVRRDFAETNLGCRNRVVSGLNWVFSQVEEAVIFEDDCLPHPDFFPFCAELLERYRDDTRVFHIGGTNVQACDAANGAGYYFSRYPPIWGWATWRRAWQCFDDSLADFPRLRLEGRLRRELFDGDLFPSVTWRSLWMQIHTGKITTVWDYQWTFACLRHHGLAAVPAANLISNLGFGDDATHTRQKGRFDNLPLRGLQFPLRHPDAVVRNATADRFTERRVFSINPYRVARTAAKLCLLSMLKSLGLKP